MSIAELKRIDSRQISDNREEVRAFMVVWNDTLRLESTLKYYRELGINRFFVVDSGSTDGTLDALAAAPDVHAFSTEGDDGISSVNTLLGTFGTGHWTLTIDPGELIVYPHFEEVGLPLLCRYLTHVRAQALPCVSLDMCAASPLSDVIHKPGSPLLDTCRYFDAAPYRVVQTDVSPMFEIHGGMRERIFDQPRSGPPPVLSRVPLVKWQAGTRYLRGTANITPVATGNMLAALLRFEFLSDFSERAPGGMTLSGGASTNLYSANSVRFENSTQLVELGLMTTTPSYEESVRLTTAAMREARAG